MKAMVLKETSKIEDRPLVMINRPTPSPGPGQLLIKVTVCGVCHTDIDEIEGRIETQKPRIIGHQIIGRVSDPGPGVTGFAKGDRVGIPWLWSSCGQCQQCLGGNENLCPDFQATGSDVDGGYAEFTLAPAAFAHRIPEALGDSQAAPLLCAGAIGYRALRLTRLKRAKKLGLYGFGAAAHLVIQIAKYQGLPVFVFTRSEEHRRLAERLGAAWTGAPQAPPPEKHEAAIDFTPVGETIPTALENLIGGGRLVIAVIRKKTPIPPLDYAAHLWDEKEIKSVANVTRADVREVLDLAAEMPVVPEIQEFALGQANDALGLLKEGKIQGAAIIRIS